MKVICSALLIAGAVTLASSSGSIAAPIGADAIKAAADEISIGESVHCRPFRHWHRWGYGRGCRGGVVIYDRGPRFRGRVGVHVRDGFRDRAGVSIRSRESTTIRSGTRDGFRSGTRDGASVGGSATIRSGGGTSVRGSAGARTGGGGTMNTAPAGQTQGGGGASVGGGASGGVSTGGGSQNQNR